MNSDADNATVYLPLVRPDRLRNFYILERIIALKVFAQYYHSKLRLAAEFKIIFLL